MRYFGTRSSRFVASALAAGAVIGTAASPAMAHPGHIHASDISGWHVIGVLLGAITLSLLGLGIGRLMPGRSTNSPTASRAERSRRDAR